MSPEIKMNGVLIARVPDETGWHEMLDGSPIYINVDQISAENKTQAIIVEAEKLKGERRIGLTQEGIGKSTDPKRGDGKLPEVDILLLDRPIRISYREKLLVEKTPTRSLGGPNETRRYYVNSKRTYKNPRWLPGYGQR